LLGLRPAHDLLRSGNTADRPFIARSRLLALRDSRPNFSVVAGDEMSEYIEKSIQVHVPVRTAYNQWTQFEEFPRFMEGVKEVRQLDDEHVHWVAEIGGVEKEWDAEITEQIPDKRIAWSSTNGARNAGIVEFQPVGTEDTEVRVRMEYQPEGAVETIGNWMKAADARVKGDLNRFKDFVESRGGETGAWRGEVHGGQTTRKRTS
jgi:uncharacterized membrane protein